MDDLATQMPAGLIIVLLGCTGSPVSTEADASPAADGLMDAARDVAPAGHDQAPAPDATEDIAGFPVDTRPAMTGLPLPAGVPPPLRILDSTATLTGEGLSSCSHQEPPSGNGDRWCVFTKPGTRAGAAELWVMNVTAASSGTVPVCDGSSAACVRMTANLWAAYPTAGPSHPYSHAFDGDTLIFYADSSTGSSELHRGPVYAWRPGWSKPRQLSSANGLLCRGHRLAAVAYCLDDVAGDPMKPDSFEVRAGVISDETAGLLPSLGRARPFRSDGSTSWQIDFSPAGDVLALSSPDPDPAVETLRIAAMTGQPMLVEVLRDVTSWSIANDGQRIYFLRQEAPPLHELYHAAFPAPSTATKVATSVEDYVVAGSGPRDEGVGYMTRVDAETREFRLARDPTRPSAAPKVFSFKDHIEDAQITPDVRFTEWRDADLVARVVRNDDLSSCVLNTSVRLDATEPRFLTNSRLVFWTENATVDLDRQDGFWSSPDDCRDKNRFAEGVYLVEEVVGERGLVFLDEYDATEDAGTLKYAAVSIANDRWSLAPPVRIQAKAKPAVTLVGSKPLLLVFEKAAGEDGAAGTYLFGPVPF
jgi:hypothetical protein